MTNYTIQTLSEAVAEKLGIDAYIYDGEEPFIDDECNYLGMQPKRLWLVDDTKRMAELAVEHDIYVDKILSVCGRVYSYLVDFNENNEVCITDHPSKLHAWRWAIALALLEV